jgi:carbon-monoxide dehydrogenase large subunit
MLRGTARFTEDLPVPDGCLHAAFVRSHDAHGHITSISTAEAAAMPGVAAVLTAADLAVEPFSYFPTLPLSEHMKRPVLATGKVRFVGEPVALVLADTRAAAVDAAERVVVDIEPLPAVVDLVMARSGDAPILHSSAGTNVVLDAPAAKGDPLTGSFVVAHVVAENPRLLSAPLETSGILAAPAATGEGVLDVWAPSQGPQGPQQDLARALLLDPNDVRVRSPYVGGGFGGRGGAIFEFVAISRAALDLQRPVRWIESRSELFFSMPHGRGQTHDFSIGFDSDGTIVGFEVEMWCDTGAYPHMAAMLASASRRQCTAMYRVPRFSYVFGAVATNTPTVGAYRGAGQPEVTAAIERAMDIGAAKLGIDPIELRRRNLISTNDLPYETGTGITIDSGDPIGVLESAVAAAEVDQWRLEQAKRRAGSESLQIGIGVSCYSQTAGSGGAPDAAELELGADGSVHISCGSQGHGQGHHSLWSAIVADRIGVSAASVTVDDGDTRTVAESQTTGGSRTAQNLGGQIAAGAELLAERVKLAAAALLEADPRDLVLGPEGVSVVGVPSKLVGWDDIVADGRGFRVSIEVPGSGPTHPYGTHVSIVEVDTETGGVQLLAHVAADDCGVVLNKASTEAQQHGGAVSGISQALFEVALWDDDGTPRNTTFADYLLPGPSELPFITTIRPGIPTERNPIGVRGIGENGAIAAPPAVQNAVIDALSHLGVTHIDMPLTPQRVWDSLRG